MILLALSLLAVGSCKKKLTCDEYTRMQEEPPSPFLLFYVLDKNTEADLIGTSYTLDSIKVSRISMDKPNVILELYRPGNSKDSYGKYRFAINLDGFEYQGYKIDYFRIYFNHQDSDTLMVKREGTPQKECSHSLSFYQNGKLLLTHDYSSGSIPEIKLKK